MTVENGASPLELVFRTIDVIPKGGELFVDYGVASQCVLYEQFVDGSGC